MPKSRSTRRQAISNRRLRTQILGDHPSPPHPFGKVFSWKDAKTTTKVPHRALSVTDGKREFAAAAISGMLVRHHVSPEALKRSEQQREAMKRLGLESHQARLRRFPTNPSTRKGNLAEIVLAEYVVAASGLTLPVYRLRYNPNVDQSMKGDDVLAFDLDSDPVRVVVGEAKFRATSSATAVTEIVEGLIRSHKAGVPASLQFVADRLFEEGQPDLGMRVSGCAVLFAREKLRVDYIGLLLSDAQSATRVDDATPGTLRRLAMISLGVEDPDSLVNACYQALD
jgi:Cap4 SAVED domain